MTLFVPSHRKKDDEFLCIHSLIEVAMIRAEGLIIFQLSRSKQSHSHPSICFCGPEWKRGGPHWLRGGRNFLLGVINL